MIVNNIKIYALAAYLNAGLQFLTAPILAKLLPADQYGISVNYITTLSLLVVAASYGTVNLVSVDATQSDERAARSIASILVLMLLLTPLTTLVAYIIPPISHTNVILAALLSLAALLQGYTTILLALYQANYHANKFALLSTVSTLLVFLLSYAFIFAYEKSWEARLYGVLVAYLSMGAYSVVNLLRFVKHSSQQVHKSDLIASFINGTKLIPHNFGNFAITWSSIYVINHNLGAVAVANYHIAMLFGMAFGIVLDAINNAVTPKYFRLLRSGDTSESVIIKFKKWYLFGSLPTALIASILSYGLVSFIYGEKYFVEIATFAFIFLGFLVKGFSYFYTNYLFYKKEMLYVSSATISGAAVSIALSLILINSNGLVGVAFSFCVGRFVALLVSIWHARNVMRMGFGD